MGVTTDRKSREAAPGILNPTRIALHASLRDRSCEDTEPNQPLVVPSLCHRPCPESAIPDTGTAPIPAGARSWQLWGRSGPVSSRSPGDKGAFAGHNAPVTPLPSPGGDSAAAGSEEEPHPLYFW